MNVCSGTHSPKNGVCAIDRNKTEKIEMWDGVSESMSYISIMPTYATATIRTTMTTTATDNDDDNNNV